ncbi:hypothetical protein MKZ38_009862 [Zalerion maritima]|uniref:Uncharacterized protein n=1 Tax=Zalerion maritima TaxID=339359 RepID=A0AAD5RSW6_9PEZI|nr:hypothetical protein MKZ38_009862 [Zalerion maritima]
MSKRAGLRRNELEAFGAQLGQYGSMRNASRNQIRHQQVVQIDTSQNDDAQTANKTGNMVVNDPTAAAQTNKEECVTDISKQRQGVAGQNELRTNADRAPSRASQVSIASLECVNEGDSSSLLKATMVRRGVSPRSSQRRPGREVVEKGKERAVPRRPSETRYPIGPQQTPHSIINLSQAQAESQFQYVPAETGGTQVQAKPQSPLQTSAAPKRQGGFRRWAQRRLGTSRVAIRRKPTAAGGRKELPTAQYQYQAPKHEMGAPGIQKQLHTLKRALAIKRRGSKIPVPVPRRSSPQSDDQTPSRRSTRSMTLDLIRNLPNLPVVKHSSVNGDDDTKDEGTVRRAREEAGQILEGNIVLRRPRRWERPGVFNHRSVNPASKGSMPNESSVSSLTRPTSASSSFLRPSDLSRLAGPSQASDFTDIRRSSDARSEDVQPRHQPQKGSVAITRGQSTPEARATTTSISTSPRCGNDNGGGRMLRSTIYITAKEYLESAGTRPMSRRDIEAKQMVRRELSSLPEFSGDGKAMSRRPAHVVPVAAAASGADWEESDVVLQGLEQHEKGEDWEEVIDVAKEHQHKCSVYIKIILAFVVLVVTIIVFWYFHLS